MTSVVLGISAFGHDTSSCLVSLVNNEVIFASAEERFTNIKHDDAIPYMSINQCLEICRKNNYNINSIALGSNYKLFLDTEVKKFLYNNLSFSDYIFFFEEIKSSIDDGYFDNFFNNNKKIRKILNLLKKKFDKNKYSNFIKILSWHFNWSVKNFKIHELLKKKFPNIQIKLVDHHLSHAASAFFNSGFKNSNIIVLDGQGENSTVSLYEANKNHFKLISQSGWPNSLGILYLEATRLLGFSQGDEYKVMGMSAYGKKYLSDIFKNFFKIDDNCKITFYENEYIKFKNLEGTAYKSITFKDKIKTIIPTPINGVFLQSHYDFAKTIQNFTEEVGVNLSKIIKKKTSCNKLCISGGVALNGLMNNKIANLKIFDDIFVYPASGDDGTSVGAAQYIVSQINQNSNNKKINTCFLGFENSKDEINLYVKNINNKNINIIQPDSIFKYLAKKIFENKVVAVFNGKSEFGPRALGARSIIANPTDPKIKEILNEKVKLREPFRPFAPICLEEEIKNYFDLNVESNFMLFICDTLKDKKKLIPGVVHEDGTARVQSVNEENYFFYNLLLEFKKISNIPILINTSFNVGGEAIVNDIDDAFKSFNFMDIDYLVADKYIFEKKNKSFKNKNLKNFLKKRIEKNKKKFSDKKINISFYNSHFYYNFFYKLKIIVKSFFMKNYL